MFGQQNKYITQYGHKILSFSSEYYGYEAKNLIGGPKVYPNHSFDNKTWSPSSYGKEEYIEIKLKTPVKIQEIEIYETFNPGFITKISCKDPSSQWDILYSGKKTPIGQTSRIFKPNLSIKNYVTKSIRIEIDLKGVSHYYCLDSIQVKGYEGNNIYEVHNEIELTESLYTFYDNKLFSDMKFICQEKEIYTHSIILSCLCPLLKLEKEMKIDYVSFDILSKVLKYIYSGLIDITTENVNSIIKCSDQFGLLELKSNCFEFLVRSVDQHSVCELIMKAKQKKFDFNSDELIQACLKFIDENTENVCNSDNFILLSEDLICDIVKSDNITTDELTLFNAIVKWGQYQIQQQKIDISLSKFLEKPASFIRYALISPYDLVFSVKPTKIAPIKSYIEAVEYHARPEKVNQNSYQIKSRGCILKGSTIISSSQAKILEKWFDKKPKSFELIYKGTRDGFQASKFHSKCDKKGSTLTIIQSHKNNIFGGFNPKNWEQNSQYTYDQGTWLFTLQNLDKVSPTKLKSYSSHNGCYNYSTYGPCFGGGFDLYICDNCNTQKSSYSSLGHSFQLPTGYSYGNTNSQNLLAGEYYFSVKEIEVFKVTL